MARFSRATAIEDAARQALFVHRDRHFQDIEWEEDRYIPRRQSGQSACRVAAPIGEMNYKLPSLLECEARLNTNLDQALDELDALREAYITVCHENLDLKRQLNGDPAPEMPNNTAESPQRNRGGHGDPNTSTTIDP